MNAPAQSPNGGAGRHHPLRRLRTAALIEGVTLFTLLCIAVPLKHLLSLPTAVSIIGPVHGLAFVFYLWMVINTAAAEDWSRSEIMLAVATAMLPFGAFLNAASMWRKKAKMDQSCSI